MGDRLEPLPLLGRLDDPIPRPPSNDAPRQFLRQDSAGINNMAESVVRVQEQRMRSNSQRRERGRRGRRKTCGTMLGAILLTSTFSSANAAFIPFENCLDSSIVNSDPLILQFVPFLVSASLESSSDTRNLDVTVYGNVSGLVTQQPYPPPDDPGWTDPSVTVGKIVDVVEANNKYSTLFSSLSVLSFTPYINDPARFCPLVDQGECPLGPVFNASRDDPSQLRSFTVSHELHSAYSFTSLSSSITVSSGDAAQSRLACIAADITPDLGTTLRSVLRFIPLVILLMVGIATITAAIYSPWGSTDLFRWTSNYGRDEDLLRLVTPGFGDCLQYIQFVVLTGSLTLDYPGYYRPVVSQASWSTLMFNESLVSHGNGTDAIQDGIYAVDADYGLHSMSQYVGITGVEDIWAGMVVWLLCIVAGVVLIIQSGFILRWAHHKLRNIPEEDLQAKNMPFTVGNVVRVVFNYLLLPIVSLSMFQLVVAGSSPVFTVALAVVLLVVLISFTSWLLFLVARTRPRSFLFDDLPTVLLYGPLYNTYSDGAAPFALISVLLTFIRGIAIGAVQPSGVAQVVLLAICEVILVLTIAAFRPFHYATSMNAYHTLFAIIRCVTILLSVAFVPSLNVSPAARGWIGYVILVLHGFVLVFGFFLNAIQTLIEVVARLAGAGGEGGAEGGAARGGLVKVFGVRQLSRRDPRRRHIPHHSITSEAAMLGAEMERPSTQLDGERARSFSGSSGLLLNRGIGIESRVSAGFDTTSLYGTGNSRTGGSGPYTPTPTTTGAMSAFSAIGQPSGGGGSPRSGLVGIRHAEPADPYYRPPRHRRATSDSPAGGGGRRSGPWASGDWTYRPSNSAPDGDDDSDLRRGSVASGRGTPTPAYLKAPREDSDDADGNGQPGTDYAVREVDFYYRVRGPALSNVSNRKLKTGPADPTGPVSAATGWLRGVFGGKTKEKGKGFEVVRSARAHPPPELMPPSGHNTLTEPYRDDPQSTEHVAVGVASTSRDPDSTGEQSAEDQAKEPKRTTSKAHSYLPPIVRSDSIELPDRVGSQREPQNPGLRIKPPTIPRKSSRRQSSIDTQEQGLGLGNMPKVGTEPRVSEDPASIEATETPTPTTNRALGESQAGVFPFRSKSTSTRSDLVSSHSQGSSGNNDDENTTRPAAYHSRMGSRGRTGDTGSASRSSVGYVRQHRASDNIHRPSSDDAPFSGSTAEIIKEP